ncbi:MAG: hypothetical protein IJU95_06985, partial [Treponema sp.]|nr:hypothetical protein [Treponema sp.]
FGAGYTYNGDAVRVSYLDFDGMGLERVFVGGRHKASASVTARLGGLRVSVDGLYNFNRRQSIYDLYAGARAEYVVIPGKLDLSLAAGLALDFGNESEDGVGFTRDREKALDDLKMYTYGTYWFFAKRGSGSRNDERRRAQVAAPMVEVQPGMTYVAGRSTFTARADLQYWLDGEGSWAASFPLSWKYSF